MSKWEYLSFTLPPAELNQFHEKLNQFGDSGWEMVSMVAVKTELTSWTDSGANTSGIIVVFKRPKD